MEDKFSKERAGKLLDATLLRYCETMNLIDDTSVCDSMFEHLLVGDLDREFICPKLEEATPEKKEKAFDIARKYAYLCFYEGNVDFWGDSVEGYNPSIPSELIARVILSNYNFLIELAYEKGEEAVSELVNFAQSYMASESSVVDYLRNTFDNDDILKEMLSITSKEEGMYKDLSSRMKVILYTYPSGVLYLDNDGIVMPTSKEHLFSEIADITFDSSIKKSETLSDVAESLGDEFFANVIRDVHLKYLDSEKEAKFSK